MKRTFILALILTTSALGYWCWSYQQYRNAMTDVISAQKDGDPQAAADALGGLKASRAFWPLEQFPAITRRLAYADASVALAQGRFTDAILGLTVVSADDADELAARALYNRGNLTVAKGLLEVARAEYVEALTADPDDLQTKINLELLLVRIKQQQQGKDKLGDVLKDMQALTDIWLRDFEKDDRSAGSQSKRVWR